MQFITAFLWSFFLMQMASYVISSMTDSTYDFIQATILSVVVGVIVVAMTALIPNEPVEHH
ncbi:YjzD family protein [Ectobacillus antri]|uniref:YjzD family protein n=1 Tax=Ectobacillus antri TaxID=2486280 RepID=UPI000F59D656|nr:YjzD family protein [Ectobacillus antri]